MNESRNDGQMGRLADKQGSDGLTIQREIVKGLMVMDGRAQSQRQIIRQAANAELLAADVYLSHLSEEAGGELSVMYTVQFDRLS